MDLWGMGMPISRLGTEEWGCDPERIAHYAELALDDGGKEISDGEEQDRRNRKR
jgi:hypothetical protein